MASAALHPVHSTSEPARAAEGLEPVTPHASATVPHKDKPKSQPNGAGAGKEGKDKPQGKPKEKKDKKSGGGAGPLELSPPPEYFAERIKIFDEYKAKYDKWVSGKSALYSVRATVLIG